MIKTYKTAWGLEGPNRRWLFAVSHSTRASRHQLQTTCGRWFLMTPPHCGYSKFIWAQRLEKFTLASWPREIFGPKSLSFKEVLHSCCWNQPYCFLDPALRKASCAFNDVQPPGQTWGWKEVRLWCFSDALQSWWGFFKAWSVPGASIPKIIHWRCWCQVQEHGAVLFIWSSSSSLLEKLVSKPCGSSNINSDIYCGLNQFDDWARLS